MRDQFFLFDLDGTLTDSAEGILKSVKMVLDHYGIKLSDESELRRFIGPPLRMTFREYGVPEHEIEEALRLYRSRYFSVGKFENHPYPGIQELLERLTVEGYRLYIATSKPEDLSIEILRHFGLAKYFHRICGASMDRSADTKDKVIERLLSDISAECPKENAVMIGDTAFDVLGAKTHGIPCVGVAWGYGTRAELDEAGAIAVVDSAEELYHVLTREYAVAGGQ